MRSCTVLLNTVTNCTALHWFIGTIKCYNYSKWYWEDIGFSVTLYSLFNKERKIHLLRILFQSNTIRKHVSQCKNKRTTIFLYARSGIARDRDYWISITAKPIKFYIHSINNFHLNCVVKMLFIFFYVPYCDAKSQYETI